MAKAARTGRRWIVGGRVQGVGYRYFIAQAAGTAGVTGYARNLDDGRVEVYAAGTPQQLDALSGAVRQGPRWSDVRTVEEREEAAAASPGFRIE